MKPVTIFDSGAESKTHNEGHVTLGFALGVILNLLQVGLVAVLNDQFSSDSISEPILLVGLGAAGIVQLFYIIPLYTYFRRKGKTETAKGLLIAASLVILVNGLCWGAFGLGR